MWGCVKGIREGHRGSSQIRYVTLKTSPTRCIGSPLKVRHTCWLSVMQGSCLCLVTLALWQYFYSRWWAESFISQRLHQKASDVNRTVNSFLLISCSAALKTVARNISALHCTYCNSAINWRLLLCYTSSLSCKWLCKSMGKQASIRGMKGFKTYYAAFDTGCQKISQCFLSLKKDNHPSAESAYA